jgi:hypothetical protein
MKINEILYAAIFEDEVLDTYEYPILHDNLNFVKDDLKLMRSNEGFKSIKNKIQIKKVRLVYDQG